MVSAKLFAVVASAALASAAAIPHSLLNNTRAVAADAALHNHNMKYMAAAPKHASGREKEKLKAEIRHGAKHAAYAGKSITRVFKAFGDIVHDAIDDIRKEVNKEFKHGSKKAKHNHMESKHAHKEHEKRDTPYQGSEIPRAERATLIPFSPKGIDSATYSFFSDVSRNGTAKRTAKLEKERRLKEEEAKRAEEEQNDKEAAQKGENYDEEEAEKRTNEAQEKIVEQAAKKLHVGPKLVREKEEKVERIDKEQKKSIEKEQDKAIELAAQQLHVQPQLVREKILQGLGPVELQENNIEVEEAPKKRAKKTLKEMVKEMIKNTPKKMFKKTPKKEEGCEKAKLIVWPFRSRSRNCPNALILIAEKKNGTAAN